MRLAIGDLPLLLTIANSEQCGSLKEQSDTIYRAVASVRQMPSLNFGPEVHKRIFFLV